jgi:hypothetical protein
MQLNAPPALLQSPNVSGHPTERLRMEQGKRVLNVAAIGATLFITTGGVADAARTYSNCTKLNKVYPHGVGKPGARDKTSGARVTNFKRSRALYKANKARDRDGDGIACEKA